MSNLFPQPKIIQPSLHFPIRAFASLFCVGARHLSILGKCPPGAEYCVLHLAFVLHSAVNIFYQYV